MKAMRNNFLFQKIIILAGLIYCTIAQDHYGNKVSLDSNNGFSVEYHETYKVLTNLITNEKYALVCCNNSLTNFTTGYHAALNTPLNTVGIATELDSLPFFELLNLTDKVKSASPSANVTSPCFAGVSDGPANGTAIDAIFTTQSNSGVVGTGTQYISVSTGSTNLTPLQQSAWIVFIAHFFEQEVAANSILTSIQNLYNCHKSNLANSGSKSIAWTTYDVVGKAWTIHYDPYTNTLIQDAGMKLSASNNQSTVYTNISDFQNAISNVDFIIDDTPAANFKTDFVYSEWMNAAGLNLSSPDNFVANKNVYRTDKLINANGYSDFPIRHSARADLAISDVIHMVYSTYEPSYNMTWLRTFARLNDPTFVSNATYPSCSNPLASLDLDVCSIAPFSPNTPVSTSPTPSTNPSIHKELSVGAKIGIVIGVCAGVAALAVVGVFMYKRRSVQQKEGTFVRMNDM